mmetsp:Transcript_10764/g.21824  ORF Transcript_10764/g.21824 Transcript_10764/m.21824 type:complete len:87 (-) Transcript_10764:7-267(-)
MSGALARSGKEDLFWWVSDMVKAAHGSRGKEGLSWSKPLEKDIEKDIERTCSKPLPRLLEDGPVYAISAASFAAAQHSCTPSFLPL